MRNFAKIIDLGTCECCVYRQEVRLLVFVFWLRKGKQVLSPMVSKEYPGGWLLDIIFAEKEDLLKEEAEKVYAMLQVQIDLHDEQLKDGVPLVLEGDMIDKLHKPSNND